MPHLPVSMLSAYIIRGQIEALTSQPSIMVTLGRGIRTLLFQCATAKLTKCVVINLRDRVFLGRRKNSRWLNLRAHCAEFGNRHFAHFPNGISGGLGRSRQLRCAMLFVSIRAERPVPRQNSIRPSKCSIPVNQSGACESFPGPNMCPSGL